MDAIFRISHFQNALFLSRIICIKHKSGLTTETRFIMCDTCVWVELDAHAQLPHLKIEGVGGRVGVQGQLLGDGKICYTGLSSKTCPGQIGGEDRSRAIEKY